MTADWELELSKRLNEMEDALVEAGIFDSGHDGWDGAAGCEIRGYGDYEPYPHMWDYTLGWCRVSWAIKLLDAGVIEWLPIKDELDAPYNEVEDIPPEIFARAI